MRSVGEPLVRTTREAPALADGEVLVRVAGCGVCHTDLGYLYDGVRTRHPMPLTLGHEIAGVVEAAGAGAEVAVGAKVIVPAVIPCGRCALCEAGRGSICKRQIFPGNDVHGGFASHVVVPAHGLCAVTDADLAASGLQLADLSVVADAVSTTYNAVARAGVGAGDLAVFVGAGGVGGFGAQIARSLGATVVALDVDASRLQQLARHGRIEHTMTVDGRSAKELRAALKELAPTDTCWKIFETSGTAAGQRLAFGLLTFGAHLGVVGYTMDEVAVRLSNLMAFDATAQGTWGCPPELYPDALDLVLAGDVRVAPFCQRTPMSEINETLARLHDRRLALRPVLVPDFEPGESR